MEQISVRFISSRSRGGHEGQVEAFGLALKMHDYAFAAFLFPSGQIALDVLLAPG